MKNPNSNSTSTPVEECFNPVFSQFFGNGIGGRSSADNFITNLAHELRTPMIGILGSADLLEQSALNNAQLALVDDIKACGDVLLANIDDMLELIKLNYGLAEINPTAVNLHDQLLKWLPGFEKGLHDQGWLLEVNLDPSLQINAALDPARLQQIINSLLTNGPIFYGWHEVHLSARVDASLSSNHLYITVSYVCANIRMDSAKTHPLPGQSCMTSPVKGNVLGAVLCRQLIELMGGEVYTQGRPDAGAIIEVKLPFESVPQSLSEEPAATGTNSNLDDEFAASFVPVSILLVDDNEMNQKLIGQMLTNYGFEVITANDGLQALNMLQRKVFDLVLLDMQMPRMNGYETARLIRENHAWSHLPIIAITANSLNGDREKCLNYGCNSYLAKPFKSETLVREIKRLLRNDFIKDKNADLFSQQLIIELLPEFLEMLDEMLAELKAAIKIKDEVQIKSISHNLKGTAGMYGFMKISQLAANMEKAVGETNYTLLLSLYQQVVTLARESHAQMISQGII